MPSASTTCGARRASPRRSTCSSTAASIARTTPARAGPTSAPTAGFPPISASRSPSIPTTPTARSSMPLVADMDRVTPDGKVRVYETRDRGESWRALENGLPQSQRLSHRAAPGFLQRRGKPARPLLRGDVGRGVRLRRRRPHVVHGCNPPATGRLGAVRVRRRARSKQRCTRSCPASNGSPPARASWPRRRSSRALRDELARERRELPWVKVEKSYTIRRTGRQGNRCPTCSPAEGSWSSYHFMFGPDWNEGCPSCSFWADNYNGNVVHLEHRDVSFVVISRAPLAKLEAYKRRMGWSFKWVSSLGNDFNRDYHVSFTPEEQKTAVYNYKAGDVGSSEAARRQRVHQRRGRPNISHLFVLCARAGHAATAPISCSIFCRRAATSRACRTRWRGCDGTTDTRVDSGCGEASDLSLARSAISGSASARGLSPSLKKESVMKLYGFPAVPQHLEGPRRCASDGHAAGAGARRPDQGRAAQARIPGAQPDGAHADAGRRRLHALGIERDHAVPRQPRRRRRSGPTTPSARADIMRWQSWHLQHWSRGTNT